MKARIPNQNRASKNEMVQRIQKMQEDMEKAQSEVENAEFTASAGGGAVEVRVSGRHEVLGITIKPEVVDPEDVEMLEDLLKASLNEAIRKSSDTMDREISNVTGGMNIPGLSGFGL